MKTVSITVYNNDTHENEIEVNLMADCDTADDLKVLLARAYAAAASAVSTSP